MAVKKEHLKDSLKASILSQESIKQLMKEFRALTFTKISKNKNYDLSYIKLADFDLKTLSDKHWDDAPLLIQDNFGKCWLFGVDEQRQLKLSKLSSNFKINLNFKPTMSRISYRDILKLNKDFYSEINKVKGHIQMFHYSHFPKKISEDQKLEDEAVQRMENFVNSDESQLLFTQIMKLFMDFQQADLDKLNTKEETERGKQLKNCMKQLEGGGFYGIPQGEKINFWSGDIAHEKADLMPNEISCSNVPIVSLLFVFADFLKVDKNIDINNVVTEAISKLLALEASGDVNVYISSYKLREKSGITVGNTFWNSELQVLQEGVKAKKINTINVHLYNDENQQWCEPIDINSNQACDLVLARRNAYQPDLKKLSEKFAVEQFKKFEEITEFGPKANKFIDGISAFNNSNHWRRNSGARPFITIGKTRELIAHWRMVKNRSALTRTFLSQTLAKIDKVDELVDQKISSETKASKEKRNSQIQAFVLHRWKNLAPIFTPPAFFPTISCSGESVGSNSACSSPTGSRSGPGLSDCGDMKGNTTLQSSESLKEANFQRVSSYNGLAPSMYQ